MEDQFHELPTTRVDWSQWCSVFFRPRPNRVQGKERLKCKYNPSLLVVPCHIYTHACLSKESPVCNVSAASLGNILFRAAVPRHKKRGEDTKGRVPCNGQRFKSPRLGEHGPSVPERISVTCCRLADGSVISLLERRFAVCTRRQSCECQRRATRICEVENGVVRSRQVGRRTRRVFPSALRGERDLTRIRAAQM